MAKDEKDNKDKQKVEELRKDLENLKEERTKLNNIVSEKGKKLKTIYGQLSDIFGEAKDIKKKRDKSNEEVSKYKSERDKINAQISKVKKKLAEIAPKKEAGISRRDYESAKKEYEKLNWMMQTSPQSKTEETKTIKRLEELELIVKQYSDAQPATKESAELEREIEALKVNADSFHKLLIKASSEGEQYHEDMHQQYKKADKLKVEAKELEREFLADKDKADEAHKKFVDVLQKLRKIEKKLGIEVKREKDAYREKKETDILSELKSGKKITTDDLLMLQG